jgi:hypothetical protein
MLRSLVIKIEYRRALHESSRKLHLPESSRLHELISAYAKLNRQIREVERPVTPTKQTTAARSNRQIFQKRGCGVRRGGCDVRVPRPPGGLSRQQSASLPGLPAVFSEGLPRAFFAKGSVCSPAFLPGSAQYVECDVTHSKQTAATFLPGSRIARHRALSAHNSQPIKAWEFEECPASPRAEACDGKM